MIAYYTKFVTEVDERDYFIELLIEAATSMRENDMCMLYIVNEDSKNAGVTWVTEVWVNSDAHQKSLMTDSVKELIAKAMPMLIAKPEQIELVPTGGKGL